MVLLGAFRWPTKSWYSFLYLQLSSVNIGFLLSTAGVVARDSLCASSSCSCSSDNECSRLAGLKCECPCTSTLEFFHCRSQFPNSRLVKRTQSPFMSSEDEHRLARWQLTALFNNMERNSPVIERREENVCFLNGLLHVKGRFRQKWKP